MSGHHVESKTLYFVIFGALMALTALTVGVTKIDFGALNIVVALAIASVKATLVVLFFMHVRHSTKLTKMVVVGSVIWLGFMFLFTFSDYLTRGWLGPLGK